MSHVYDEKKIEWEEKRLHNFTTIPISHCASKWPKIEIVIPLQLNNESSDNADFENIFLRSFLLFWPRNTSTGITLILDYEIRDSPLEQLYIDDVIHKGIEKFGSAFPVISKMYQTVLKKAYRDNGTDRMSYKLLTSDMYVPDSVQFIALADANTMFYTYVALEDIMEKYKPVVHGLRMSYVDKSRRIYR